MSLEVPRLCMVDPSRPSSPTILGRYELLERIASGGMGEVYIAAAQNAGLSRLCAVKKILGSLAREPEFLERFRDEARLTLGMSHPNVVLVYELGHAHAEYYMAMELVEGRDLEQVLGRCWRQRRVISLAAALYIVREVAAALDYCHRRTDEAGVGLGLVHRDVSPTNVLVSYDGAVKLGDFGMALSSMRRVHTRPEILFGKPGYIAPERVECATVDHRADIYCAGVLLFELLTLQRFSSAQSQNARVLPSAFRASIPQELDRVVSRATALDPAQRYASARQLYEAIHQVLVSIDPHFGPFALQDGLMSQIFDVPAERRRLRSLLMLVAKTEVPRPRVVRLAAGHDSLPEVLRDEDLIEIGSYEGRVKTLRRRLNRSSG